MSRKSTVPESEGNIRTTQRNIYILGDIAYQLLFAAKYYLDDKNSNKNIKKLGAKWRTILEKSLSPNLTDRYQSYASMLSDVNKVLGRNRRITFSVTPVAALAVTIGLYYGFCQYKVYKETQRIMSSEAGQAIERFLDIIKEANNSFPQLQPPPQSQDKNDPILEPFNKIAP